MEWFKFHFDILGIANNKTVYAKKGELIKVLQQNGNVFLCETENGNRFPLSGEVYNDRTIVEKPEKKIPKQNSLFD